MTSRLDELPDEILLQILSYLEPYYIARLQLVSRTLQKFCLDDDLWKRHCFRDSSWYQMLKNRRALYRTPLEHSDDSRIASKLLEARNSDSSTTCRMAGIEPDPGWERRYRELQDMANWDPAYPDERVSWYDEYIQRKGPACVNWLQTPRMRDGGIEAFIESRGLAIYSPYDGNDGLDTMLAVSPLDDGSVCLWDVKGTRGRQGGILAKSRPDILFIDGPGGQNSRRSKRIDTGVTECVAINNNNHRAFFAVQSHLIEVDLHRLDVVSRESFEWSITSLSSVHDGVPLTVGTSLGIHLHDFRARSTPSRDMNERLDGSQWSESDVFKSIFDPKPLPPYAPLSQPTPISILHLPRQGSHSLVSDDIYVSGRFSNILHYDRRKFPAIVGSIYSGALISSLAALPYPFSTVDSELRRQAEFTTEQVSQMKATGEGRTIIAAGGYKTKGSLEIYGLSAADESGNQLTLQNSTLKNRQTAASSAILSVINHGTKIVFSDGSGLIKWFERDGSTECRRVRVGHGDDQEPSSLFASMPASDDLARKILSTKSERSQDRPNNDNILFWTGEKLGLVSFTTAPLYNVKDFDKEGPDVAEEEERRLYTERMREALEKQAEDVRIVRRLGMGTGPPR